MSEQENIQTIGKYRVIGTLGRGSMGIVYKGLDPEIGRTVAIKTLRRITSAQFADADAALERFKVEARSAGNLRHPNVITIFDVSVEGDTPYIVMDYVEGESFDIVLSREGRLPPDRALAYLEQAAGGLDAAHTRGIIHRDIKPSNLILDSEGRVYVLDFGVAKINESFNEQEKSITPEPVMGTPGYMSPEQIVNEKLDPRTDLFSFAIVAFEFFTGKRPFPGESFNEVVSNILNRKPIPLTQLAPDLPLALEVEFEKALAKKREQRFETAQEMVAALSRACGVGQNLTPSRLPSSASARPRKPSEWKPIGGIPGSESGGKESNAVEDLSKRPNVPLGFGSTVWGGNDDDARRLSQSTQLLQAPKHEKRTRGPGEMFSDGDSIFSSPSAPRSRFRPRKVLLGVLFGVAILFMGGGVYLLATGSDFSSTPHRSSTPRVRNAVTQPVLDPEQYNLVPPEQQDIPADILVDEMSADQVISVLVSPDQPEERILKAITISAQRRIPRAVEALTVPLGNDSYVVRIEAMKALGQLHDKRAVPYILPLLDDYDPLVRGYAARTLGQLGSRAGVAYLTARYAREDVPRVRSAIKDAIETLNGYPMKNP